MLLFLFLLICSSCCYFEERQIEQHRDTEARERRIYRERERKAGRQIDRHVEIGDSFVKRSKLVRSSFNLREFDLSFCCFFRH